MATAATIVPLNISRLAMEALALCDILLQWKSEATTIVLLDVHGWLNESMGDSAVGQYFSTQFGFNHVALGDEAHGYITRWGQANGMLASLIELPFPSSPQDIIDRDFRGKFIQATRDLLHNVVLPIPVTGIAISPTSVTLNSCETQQFKCSSILSTVMTLLNHEVRR